jgi:RNA polymerase sigma-70 factor (ECF subfamily)
MGDNRAMDVLVTRYHGKLLDFALRQLGDSDVSADVAQVTLVRAFECAASFDPRKAGFRTWLYTIALNLVREEFRRRMRSKETALSDVEESAEAVGSSEDEALSRILSSDLWCRVGRLREDHRIALILRFRQGLSYDEIAAVMNAPSGTVKSWVHHALRSLRNSLESTNCGG